MGEHVTPSNPARETAPGFLNAPIKEHTMQATTTLGNAAPTASTARGGAAVASPPSVIRGAKSQNTICIDWLRFSGPRCSVYEVLRHLETLFGKSELGKGRFFLDTGYHFPEGGVFIDLDQDHNKNHAVIELPGALIGELSFAQVRQLIYDISGYGYRATRIDIALDFFDRPNLINTIRESCDRGELCRSKTYQHILERSGTAMTAHGINIGKRGKKGSGRYLRVYDKGLEQKTHQPGEWVRWEVELSDTCAQQFATKFATEDDAISTALSHALWVVEFREKTSSRMLARRPLAHWFQEITQHTTRERLTAVRAKSTVESYTRWVKTSVAPKLATLARITRSTVGGVIEHISGEVNPRLDHLQCIKVREISRSMGVDPINIRERFHQQEEATGHG